MWNLSIDTLIAAAPFQNFRIYKFKLTLKHCFHWTATLKHTGDPVSEGAAREPSKKLSKETPSAMRGRAKGVVMETPSMAKGKSESVARMAGVFNVLCSFRLMFHTFIPWLGTLQAILSVLHLKKKTRAFRNYG